MGGDGAGSDVVVEIADLDGSVDGGGVGGSKVPFVKVAGGKRVLAKLDCEKGQWIRLLTFRLFGLDSCSSSELASPESVLFSQ